jgi:uncharacterized protein (TIGR02996 family)
MKPDDAFLRAVIDNPDDDTPRLVFADWLDEHDDRARAEFIRVQCELAGLSRGDRRVEALEAHERKLRSANAARWLGRLNGCPRDRVFRRGFLERVRMHGQTFTAHRRELFGLGPIREVILGGVGGQVISLGMATWMERLEVLGLRGNRLGDWSVQFLAHSPFLHRLKKLDLGGNAIADGGAEALAASPHLNGLIELRLDGNGISSDGMLAIAASKYLGGLTRLDVSNNMAHRQSRGVQALLHRFGERVRL